MKAIQLLLLGLLGLGRDRLGFRQVAGADQPFLENLDGLRHGADFVLPLDGRDIHVGRTFGKPRHHAAKFGKGTHDRAGDQECGADHDHQDDAEDGRLLKRLPLEHGIDVVHVDPGADNPVPAGNARDIGDLGRSHRSSGFEPVVVDEPAALGAGNFAELGEHRHAVGIAEIEDALSDPRRQVGVLKQDAVQAVDPEVIVAVVAKYGDCFQRRPFGGILRHVAAFRLGGECRGDAGRGIDKVLGLQLPVMEKFRPQAGQGDDADDEHPGQRQRNHGEQTATQLQIDRHPCLIPQPDGHIAGLVKDCGIRHVKKL